jgi:hypothetical protein
MPIIKEYWCSQSWCERTCEGKISLSCWENANTFQSLDSHSTDRATSPAKGSQDQSESEAHLGTQIQPHLQVYDTVHTGVRYAADYLVCNYVNVGQQRMLVELTGEKTVKGISNVDSRLALSVFEGVVSMCTVNETK